MKRPFVVAWAVAVLLGSGFAATAQGPAITPDLSKAADGKGWKVAGRNLSAFEADGKKGVRFDKQPGQGIAWLDDTEFAEGTIEVDVKGEDKPQQSFVGVAFRVVDEKTHDAVYFRPFNFKTPDAARRVRAVQYVSHPQYPWQKLRQDKPGMYEKAVNPVPDPDGWFHARIVVEKRKVSVFVDGGKEPCLVVEELSDRKGGKVGLWVGEGSGGEFANLKITPAKLQPPAARSVDGNVLGDYAGVYQWGPNAFLYLQTWNEFTGTNQLVAFDES